MIYRTCQGCVLEKELCDARDAVRLRLKGLGVTTIKWKCAERVDRYKIGDPVWAMTVCGQSADYFEQGEQLRDEFPAIVIRHMGSKALVFIKPDVEGKGHCGDGVPFEASNRGFCKIPLARLSPREGQPEKVCRSCEQPESLGHIEGYSCAFDIVKVMDAAEIDI
jgi:hypothetical protein